MNLNIFRSMSYGVYVITTKDGERPVGCIANSTMQITSTPATLAVSMNHDNYTNECIEKTGYFAVSILSEGSDASIIGTFGFHSAREVDKFANVKYVEKQGMPVITDSCGYAICKVINKMETSTHTVFLGEVVDCDVFDQSRDAMTYAYYHKVVKGSSPKNAPTYLPEESKSDVPAADGNSTKEGTAQTGGKWVCSVCGYQYEGEELPEDYICPLCGQGADKFHKE